MKRFEKFNKVIDELRKKASKENCRIAYNGNHSDNRFIVEFLKGYTIRVKSFTISFNPNKEYNYVEN